MRQKTMPSSLLIIMALMSSVVRVPNWGSRMPSSYHSFILAQAALTSGARWTSSWCPSGFSIPSVDVAAMALAMHMASAISLPEKAHAHGVVAAAYIGVHKGLGHSGDVIQRDAQVAVGVGVDAQLVQPVLAHPAQDRDAVVGASCREYPTAGRQRLPCPGSGRRRNRRGS